MAELNPKQRRFIEEYLKDLNATQAAIRAGYSAKSAKQYAHELLSDDDVEAEVVKAMEARSKRTEVTVDYVLEKIKETVERCSQAEPVLRFDEETREWVETGEWKFEHAGVLKGCELLGRHLGMWKDKVEVTEGERPLEDLSDEELMKLRGNG